METYFLHQIQIALLFLTIPCLLLMGYYAVQIRFSAKRQMRNIRAIGSMLTEAISTPDTSTDTTE